MTTPAVTISALQDSRWRCGVEHTPTPVDWPPGHWPEAQLERLRADPQLVVIVQGDEAVDELDPPTLTSAQIARLRELTPEELDAALAPPSTPTCQEQLDAAWNAWARGTPEERTAFIGRLRSHSIIGPALATPSTVKAALDTAIEAVKRATPEEAGAFYRALGFEAKAEDAIAGAVAVLKIGKDPASWTAAGIPTVAAIEAAVGFDVSADQRNAACAAQQGEGS